MILPAVTQAFQDGRLWRGDLRVYGYALERLDIADFRPLKAKSVADAFGAKRSHAARSLRRLVTLGYLESGKRDGHTRTYRLRMSVTPVARLHAA